MKCERCNKEVVIAESYTAYLDSYHDSYNDACYSCACELYKDGWEIGQEGCHESWHLCYDCEEFFPESELKVVDDGEFLCSSCIDGDLSRGCPVTIHYNADISELRAEQGKVVATPKELAELFCHETESMYGTKLYTGLSDSPKFSTFSSMEEAIKNTEEVIRRRFCK